MIIWWQKKENRVSASSGIAKRGVKEYWTIYMRKNRKLGMKHHVKGKTQLDKRWGGCIGKGEKGDKGMWKKVESMEICGVKKNEK